jgi:hypothetical protein
VSGQDTIALCALVAVVMVGALASARRLGVRAGTVLGAVGTAAAVGMAAGVGLALFGAVL